MINAIKAWLKKQNITWKSAIALAGIVVSAISAAKSAHIFPTPYNLALASVSGALLAFERFAEAFEDRTRTLERTWKSASVAQEALTAHSVTAVNTQESSRVLYARWQDALEQEQEATAGHHVASDVT